MFLSAKSSPLSLRRYFLKIQRSTLIATAFCVFSLLSIILFDFEDLLLENQLTVLGQKLVRVDAYKQQASGSIPELNIRWYHGYSNLPDWIQAKLSDAKLGAVEIFAEEQGYHHLVALKTDTGENMYLLLEADNYLISKDWIGFYLVILAFGLGVTFLLTNWLLSNALNKVSRPLEQLSSAIDQNKINDLNSIESDVVEVLKLQHAIVSKSRRVDELLAREREFNKDISHELRTPLTVLTGALEIAQQKQPSSAALKRALYAVTDLSQLVEGVLWLGRTVTGTEICYASQIAKYCKDTFFEASQEKGLTFIVEPINEDSIVPFPEPVARVIFGNLLKNAIAYTEAGTIRLNWIVDGVEVLDTGVGFGQVTPSESGFGIGLSLVEKLCKHFKLQFSVTPQEKQGTCCRIQWTGI